MCAPLAWSKASKPGLSRGAVAALSFGTIEGTPPSPVSSPDPAALFDRRLLLFTGKGGVGKSTVVASLALEAAALPSGFDLQEVNLCALRIVARTHHMPATPLLYQWFDARLRRRKWRLRQVAAEKGGAERWFVAQGLHTRDEDW